MFSKLLEVLIRILAWLESWFYPHMKMEISRCQFDDCVFERGLSLVNLKFQVVDMRNMRPIYLISTHLQN